MIIYKIINKINNKIYIGKTEKSLIERFKRHVYLAEKKTNRHLYDSMNKYGYTNFNIISIEKCNSVEELNKKEKYWINYFKSTNRKFGYNMQEGGTGGRQPLEIRLKAGKKISVINKGRKHSEETKRKISKAHKGKKGKKWSEHRKKEFSNYCKSTCRKPLVKKGKEHPMFGVTHTKEAKLKISNARKGRNYEDIFCEETSKRLKQMHRDSFTGTKNPRYKEVNIKEVIKDIEKGVLIKDILNKYGISRQGLYYKLNKIKFKRPKKLLICKSCGCDIKEKLQGKYFWCNSCRADYYRKYRRKIKCKK